jgi:hypothetical protein
MSEETNSKLYFKPADSCNDEYKELKSFSVFAETIATTGESIEELGKEFCNFSKTSTNSISLDIKLGDNHISRKRFIKLAMGWRKIQRNEANEIAKIVWNKYKCYTTVNLIFIETYKNRGVLYETRNNTSK